MTETIDCKTCEHSETCDRCCDYCTADVMRAKAEAFEKFLDEAEPILTENLIFQKIEDIISKILEDK